MNEIEAVKTMIDQYTRAQNNDAVYPTNVCLLCELCANHCDRCLWAKFYSQRYSKTVPCYDWFHSNFSTGIAYPWPRSRRYQDEAVREARARRITMLKAWLRILEDEDAQRR